MDEIQNTVNQRLQNIVDVMHGGSQAAFARHISVRTGTVGDILGKRQNKPGFEILSKIASAYPLLRTEWLLTGDGPMLKEDMPIESTKPIVNYDQAEVDERFLDEIYRLRYEGAFQTFSELAGLLQAHRSIITEIQTGRYHCNLKLIYMLDAYFEVDLMYIIRGDDSEGRPKYPKPVLTAGRPPRAVVSQGATLTQRRRQSDKQRLNKTLNEDPVWKQMLQTMIGDKQHPEIKSDGYIKHLALQILPLYEQSNGPVEDQEGYFAMIQREARAYAATLPEESILLPNTNTNTNTNSDTTK